MQPLDHINEHDIITFYARKKLEGMSYSTIKNQLRSQSYSEAEIQDIIRLIDDKVIEELDKTSANSKIKMQLGAGIILLTLGLLFTLFSFINTLPQGGYFFTLYVLMILVGGYWVIKYSRKLK